jgi:hypothetical protein
MCRDFRLFKNLCGVTSGYPKSVRGDFRLFKIYMRSPQSIANLWAVTSAYSKFMCRDFRLFKIYVP